MTTKRITLPEALRRCAPLIVGCWAIALVPMVLEARTDTSQCVAYIGGEPCLTQEDMDRVK